MGVAFQSITRCDDCETVVAVGSNTLQSQHGASRGQNRHPHAARSSETTNIDYHQHRTGLIGQKKEVEGLQKAKKLAAQGYGIPKHRLVL